MVVPHSGPASPPGHHAGPWALRRWHKLLRSARKPWRHKLTSLLHGLDRVAAPVQVRRRGLVHAARDPRTPSGLSITLTSYPARFPTLALTLRSLLSQSMRPDQVVLCLHAADLPHLPANVLALLPFGLTLLPHPQDLRVYLKAIPAMRREPERTWITADDDVCYPPDWLAGLWAAHRAAPAAVIARRTHLMRFAADGRPASYAVWQRQTASLRPDDPHFLTGIGGVLYPPGCLHAHALDEGRFLSLSPDANDEWLTWLRSLKVGLFKRNARALGNDACIAAMVRVYGHECLHSRCT